MPHSRTTSRVVALSGGVLCGLLAFGSPAFADDVDQSAAPAAEVVVVDQSAPAMPDTTVEVPAPDTTVVDQSAPPMPDTTVVDQSAPPMPDPIAVDQSAPAWPAPAVVAQSAPAWPGVVRQATRVGHGTAIVESVDSPTTEPSTTEPSTTATTAPPSTEAPTTTVASTVTPTSVVEQSAPPMPSTTTTTTIVASKASGGESGPVAGELPATGVSSWLTFAAIVVSALGTLMLGCSRRPA
jgi:hypothetical protein